MKKNIRKIILYAIGFAITSVTIANADIVETPNTSISIKIIEKCINLEKEKEYTLKTIIPGPNEDAICVMKVPGHEERAFLQKVSLNPSENTQKPDWEKIINPLKKSLINIALSNFIGLSNVFKE